MMVASRAPRIVVCCRSIPSVARRWLATSSPPGNEHPPEKTGDGQRTASKSGSPTTFERKALDHRVIGKQQKLFQFHPLSPGSAFFLPHGTRVCNRLVDEVRAMYKRYQFQEVSTPLLYDKKLWEQSGHWENYKEDMFIVQPGHHVHSDASSQASADKGGSGVSPSEATCKHTTMSVDHAQQQLGRHPGSSHSSSPSASELSASLSSNSNSSNSDNNEKPDDDGGDLIFGLKPMNCPGHCLIFASENRSYRSLPMRLADFSPLHRNENRGTLGGLTRLRRFTQDDAHIFCKHSQIEAEIQSTLRFIVELYEHLGFEKYRFSLSTRPDRYIGALGDWDAAEAVLRSTLQSYSKDGRIHIKEGDGAFYGPKIDTTVTDAFGRPHQLATVQLDFQLPKRFQLWYQDEHDSRETPVMIHRAALGSVERMLALLLEHHEGQLPFWLSPRQIMVIGIHAGVSDYVQRVSDVLGKSWYVDSAVGFDGDRNISFNKLVHDAIEDQYNYIVVVGDKEKAAGTAAVRTRKSRLGTMSIDDMVKLFSDVQAAYK